MRSVRFFKKRYLLIILILVVGYALYDFIQSPPDQRVVKSQPINNLATLYITEVDLGATTSASYRYYVYPTKAGKEGFTKAVKDNEPPFLITSDPDARVNIINGAIHLTINGNIYSFSNSPAYKSEGVILAVPVYLNASPK